jgi:hypothetical protein
MKKILLSALAVVAMMSACKKDDDNNNGSSSSYKIGTTTYTPTTVTYTDASKVLMGMSGTTAADLTQFSAIFNSTPTADASLTVVPGIPAAGEVGIIATVGTNIYSIGATSVSAAVTVTGGKIKIVVPEFTASDAANTKVSGTLVQP